MREIPKQSPSEPVNTELKEINQRLALNCLNKLNSFNSKPKQHSVYCEGCPEACGENV
jgi:hypothetical protein